MNPVKIVTDSSAYLPEKMISNSSIQVIPLTLNERLTRMQ